MKTKTPIPATKRLTTKQRLFVESYCGNGTEAARKAGYRGSEGSLRTIAAQNLTNVNILSAIEKRQNDACRKHIASRQERQQFWTSIMVDPSAEMTNRLRASELLGKSQADFILRLEHTGAEGGPIEVSAAHAKLRTIVDRLKSRSGDSSN